MKPETRSDDSVEMPSPMVRINSVDSPLLQPLAEAMRKASNLSKAEELDIASALRKHIGAGGYAEVLHTATGGAETVHMFALYAADGSKRHLRKTDSRYTISPPQEWKTLLLRQHYTKKHRKRCL